MTVFVHHQHTSLLHHPLAPTCTANLTLQLPAPSQPLGRVWQGDSDTYRATRVSPPLTPARTQRQLPGLAGTQLQQHLPHEGRAGPLPPPWGGTCPLLLHAMEASGHRSKWPGEQVATHASAHLAEPGHIPGAMGTGQERGCSGLVWLRWG